MRPFDPPAPNGGSEPWDPPEAIVEPWHDGWDDPVDAPDLDPAEEWPEELAGPEYWMWKDRAEEEG